MPQMVSTKEVLTVISECQKIFDNEIYPTLKNTQGYGHHIPETTLATWKLVQERLDALYCQWSHALKKMNPLNKRVSLESACTVSSLQKTLYRAVLQQEMLDDTTDYNLTSGEYCRWWAFNGFKTKQYPKLWNTAPEIEAYAQLCQLHKYTLERGWASAKNSQEVLSSSEIEKRKDIWGKHLKLLKKVIESKWTSIQVNPFL
ncbi:MAG: hypothetical protein OHK93_007441 [Ramalina farinacea]|uniref:Uncharacterized protein n=1 Tax=Ramalina farinacea TaxID=258253 RepID=A0AA43QLP6_9LECA|nr:hypothetical protein [Ramalina farinacea]